MAWTSIDTDALNNAKIAALIEACDTAALADGQTGRAAGIIQGVINRVRRKIASCANNRVDSDTTTVPEGLRDDVIKLIIADLKNAIEEPLTTDEKDEIERINRDLNRIAECRDTVDQPDTPVEPEVERASTIETITSTTRVATRDKLAGL